MKDPRPVTGLRPRRILVTNGAALGDVILATSVLPVLKSAYPEAELGMLVGTASMAILTGHPLLRWIHGLDHWRMDRSDRSKAYKWQRYRRTRSTALSEVKAVGYDIAIDLYYFFPNSILFLWQAGIPVRVGYTSVGFGPLLTHPCRWKLHDWSVVKYHADLLRRIGVPEEHFALLSPSIAYTVAIPGSGVLHTLKPGESYLVLHVGTGFKIKEWQLVNWRSVVGTLTDRGFKLVFTGAGAKEAQMVDRVVENMPGCVNLCNSLSWGDFVAVIAGAIGLVGVDSVAGHVAAAVKTPCVIIAPGNVNPAHWRPLQARCAVITHKVPCAPCYRQYGCDAMECVRQVRVDEVVESVGQLIGPA